MVHVSNPVNNVDQFMPVQVIWLDAKMDHVDHLPHNVLKQILLALETKLDVRVVSVLLIKKVVQMIMDVQIILLKDVKQLVIVSEIQLNVNN